MEKFEGMFEDLDVNTQVELKCFLLLHFSSFSYFIVKRSSRLKDNHICFILHVILFFQVLENAMGEATTLSTPQDQVLHM